MSTRSLIGKQFQEKSVRAVYCHSDGYIEGGVGETLFRHYQDSSKIDALMDGGDMSSLGAEIDAPEGHSFSNRVSGHTVFYGRDRGDKGTNACIYPSIKAFEKAAANAGAYYAYLYWDDEWYVQYRGNTPQPLAESFDDTNAAT